MIKRARPIHQVICLGALRFIVFSPFKCAIRLRMALTGPLTDSRPTPPPAPSHPSVVRCLQDTVYSAFSQTSSWRIDPLKMGVFPIGANDPCSLGESSPCRAPTAHVQRHEPQYTTLPIYHSTNIPIHRSPTFNKPCFHRKDPEYAEFHTILFFLCTRRHRVAPIWPAKWSDPRSKEPYVAWRSDGG